MDSHGKLSPRMNAELGERRILLGERDAFSFKIGSKKGKDVRMSVIILMFMCEQGDRVFCAYSRNSFVL